MNIEQELAKCGFSEDAIQTVLAGSWESMPNPDTPPPDLPLKDPVRSVFQVHCPSRQRRFSFTCDHEGELDDDLRFLVLFKAAQQAERWKPKREGRCPSSTP